MTLPPLSTATVEQQITVGRERSRPSTHPIVRVVLRGILTFVLTLAAVVLLWQGALTLFEVTPYVGKGPLDVWNFLFTLPNAETNRQVLLSELGITLVDATIGFVAGLTVALLAAIAFQLSKSVEAALMPVAMLLRSVPLVALAPVIIMITGRSTTAVAAMGGIVVLFPALVSIAFGLRSTSPMMNDVINVYGGNAWTALRLVALPTSLPSFFAAVRISVPGAITGALLAEWLATGSGLGAAINRYLPQAQFSAIWASVVTITIVSLVLYNLVQIIENVVLARMGMTPRRG